MKHEPTQGFGGFAGSPTYRSWYTMHERCENPKNASYPHYGARGIAVCPQWHSLPQFVKDMGLRPEGMTLDRIDPNGNYEPANCRWATELDQQRTRRNVRCSVEIAARIRRGEFAGETQKQIAARFGFDQSTVSRIKAGKAWADA